MQGNTSPDRRPDDKAQGPWDTSNNWSLTHIGGGADSPLRKPKRLSKGQRMAAWVVFIVAGCIISWLGLFRYHNFYPLVAFFAILKILADVDMIRTSAKHYKETLRQRQWVAEAKERQRQRSMFEPNAAPAAIPTPTKSRGGFFLLFLAAVGATAGNWFFQVNGGGYYRELGLIGPALATMLLGLTINPSLSGEPRPKKSELILTAWLVLGLALGGLNLYLMSL